MKNFKFIARIVGGLFLLLLVITSCNDKLDDTTFFTSDDMSVVETLEANPELFSSYLEIIEKTDFYTSFDSYGSYTCFVPTNDAIKNYIQEKFNVSSVDALTSADQIDFLKTIVKFHTLPSRRATSSFVEGRIADTTYTGDFLTTSYLLGGGIANVQINRDVTLGQYDIGTRNGIIHAINGVLDPFVNPIPKVIEDTGMYNIFTEAMKQTGYYDDFSVIFNEVGTKNNFTIFAESDAVYAQEGVNSFEELATLISPDNSDYMDKANDLNRFIAYHATSSYLYAADLPTDGFINTVLERNAIKSFRQDKTLKLNETETGVDDTWTSLLSDQSNYPAKNGVYHTVDKLFTIFTPKPKRLLFDLVSDQPEVQAGLVAHNDKTVESTRYEFVRWFPEEGKRWMRRPAGEAFNYRTVFDLAGYAWLEFDTPVLPKGKYEMLICGNNGGSRGIVQIYWDGLPIGSAYDMRTKGNASIGFPDDEALMESKGWRKGLENDGKGMTNDANLLGNRLRFIVTKELLCPVQQRHVVRLETIRSAVTPLDYIEFIPVD